MLGNYRWERGIKILPTQDFLGGPGVKTLPSNVGDASLIDPWSAN